MSEVERVTDDVVRVTADNASAFTLGGTNSYIVRGWVLDPGPRDSGHIDALLAQAGGAIEGIAITHRHLDHYGAADDLAERAGGVPIVWPVDGDDVGPFRAIATPGHSADHVALVYRRICFTGDAVLGSGSVFLSVDGGGLEAYLNSLRILRSINLDLICPGHGPVVHDPHAKLDEYIEHRLDREQKLLAALDGGARTVDEMLAQAWDDVPPEVMEHVRPAAEATLAAHLEKLEAEGRLPEGVERPSVRL
jgi:glyoxylase-like metal-dependent hydrolase (beta-lactamase superfamily II)